MVTPCQIWLKETEVDIIEHSQNLQKVMGQILFFG